MRPEEKEVRQEGTRALVLVPEHASWRRQERHLELWSRYNGVPLPDYKGEAGGAKWTAEQAEVWIKEQYQIWRNAPSRSQTLARCWIASLSGFDGFKMP